ncbi:MAG TPA: hypothetical protein VKP30_27030, partial [Polyangiaceae bacterium]|nr:hypothetical protein [Polyangiaceae bacterium]
PISRTFRSGESALISPSVWGKIEPQRTSGMSQDLDQAALASILQVMYTMVSRVAQSRSVTARA